jgi:hypothetical protein
VTSSFGDGGVVVVVYWEEAIVRLRGSGWYRYRAVRRLGGNAVEMVDKSER